MFKKICLDLLWSVLFVLCLGIIEFVLRLLFGWVLSGSDSFQSVWVFGGFPIIGGLMTLGASLIAILPFKTWFGIILSGLNAFMEYIGGLIGIWWKWWPLENNGWDIAVKVWATIFFSYIIIGGVICLFLSFKDRKIEQY